VLSSVDVSLDLLVTAPILWATTATLSHTIECPFVQLRCGLTTVPQLWHQRRKGLHFFGLDADADAVRIVFVEMIAVEIRDARESSSKTWSSRSCFLD
jgi:hypothetical protein